MSKMFDKNPQELIGKAAEGLKSVVVMPEWAKFVKTGAGKENHPLNPDWFYQRAASVLRKVYLKGPVGTSKLRKVYSFKQNRGHQRERRAYAGKKIIRVILQELEKAGFVQQAAKGAHKGRVITPKGKSFLDKCVK